MAYGSSTNRALASGFSPASGAVVLSADKSRVLRPSEGELGWTARRSRVPLGYLGDRARTGTRSRGPVTAQPAPPDSLESRWVAGRVSTGHTTER